MSVNAVLTQGTTLSRGDGGSPEVFTVISEQISFSGPDATKAEIDVTDLSSIAKEYRGGLADFGRFTAEMNYIPGNATHVAIRNDFNNAASPTRNYRINFVNGRSWNFSAYVAGLPSTIAGDSVVKATLNLRLTGLLVET